MPAASHPAPTRCGSCSAENQRSSCLDELSVYLRKVVGRNRLTSSAHVHRRRSENAGDEARQVGCTAGHVFPELFRRKLTDKENEAVSNCGTARGQPLPGAGARSRDRA